MRSEPDCSGAWTCLAMRGDAAIRPSRSSEKSIGSTELRRRRSTPVSASSRRSRSASRMRLPGSLPQRPRLMPLSTTSRYRPASAAHLLDHLLGGRAAAASAHERDDAERAAIVAAVLDFQIRARAVARGVFHRRRQKVALCENIADVNIADVNIAVIGRRASPDLRDLRLVRIAHHPLHPGIAASSSGARCA